MGEMISLCMIVRDEERFIGQCLKSVVGVVDELIVVDTGSKDRTVNIAEQFGAHIFSHAWKNDFSKARNFSLNKATGDWILIMDADEELPREEQPRIRQAIRSRECDAYLMVNVNFMPDGGISKHKNVRLFRRGKVRYEGIVHNKPVVDGTVSDSGIRLYHHGYNLSPELLSKKYKRSEVLLKKQVREESDNAYAWANLIRNHRLQQKYEEIIADGEKVMENLDLPLFIKQMISNDLLYAYFITGRLEKALRLGQDGLRDNPYHPDMLFIMGGVLVKQRRIMEGIRCFHQYLDVLSSNREITGLEGLIIDTYGYQGKAWNNLGSGYLELGRIDLAVKAYRAAICHEKINSLYYKNLAGLYLRMGDVPSAAEVFEAAKSAGAVDAEIDNHLKRWKVSLKKEKPTYHREEALA